jgi:hypothetical protein
MYVFGIVMSYDMNCSKGDKKREKKAHAYKQRNTQKSFVRRSARYVVYESPCLVAKIFQDDLFRDMTSHTTG